MARDNSPRDGGREPSRRPSAGGDQPWVAGGANTDATTAGLLPDGPGVALLALAAGGVVAVGVALGYCPVALGALCLTGALGALGVRAATRDGRGAFGVALLWVAAVAFAALTVVLAGESVAGTQSLGAVLVVASATLLAPFGLLGSTVRLYGHGAGRRVVRRYLVGTLLLAGVAVALFVGSWLLSRGWDLLPPVAVSELVSGTLVRRLAVAATVYWAGLFVGVRAVRAAPVAVFVAAGSFDRVRQARTTVEQLYRYGLGVVVLYVAVALVGLGFVAEGGTAGRAVERLLRASTWPPGVAAVGTATAVLAALLVIVSLSRSVGGLTRAAVAEVVLPPAVVGGVAVLAATVAAAPLGGRVDAIAGTALAEAFLTAVSPAWLVGLLAVLFLVSAAVFATPTLVAATGLGDESLAGIASAALAVVLLVLVAVLAGQGFVAIAGVALAALVWEFGEFATVAAGELGAPDGRPPDGFARLASVHAVTTLVVTAGAAVLAGLVFVTATGTALSTTAGTVVLVVTGLGVGALVLLLNG